MTLGESAYASVRMKRAFVVVGKALAFWWVSKIAGTKPKNDAQIRWVGAFARRSPLALERWENVAGKFQAQRIDRTVDKSRHHCNPVANGHR